MKHYLIIKMKNYSKYTGKENPKIFIGNSKKGDKCVS